MAMDKESREFRDGFKAADYLAPEEGAADRIVRITGYILAGHANGAFTEGIIARDLEVLASAAKNS